MPDVMINETDIAGFNAILLSSDIQPTTETTFTDWPRQSADPLFYGTQQTYKVIKLSFWIRDTDKAACEADISGLCNALRRCTLKFDDLPYYYDCQVSETPVKTQKTDRKWQLDITLQSGYAYLPAVSTTLAGTSGTLNVPGNLPGPAVVTLTPTQDIGSVTLTGLTKKPIVINNLHANVPVTVDGEKCTVTEENLDNAITASTGAGNWIFRKYNMASVADPDDNDIHLLPTKATIPAGQSYVQQLIADGANLVHNIGYDYLGYLKTAVQVSSAKIVTLSLYHDDGCSVYAGGTQVYGHNYHKVEWDSTGAASVPLTLSAGWNLIEIIWIQHYGPDGIYGITPVLGSQVNQLNAYYARDTSGAGLVNKFGDANMWAFPALQPGDNTVSIDSTVCAVSISYKPKFM